MTKTFLQFLKESCISLNESASAMDPSSMYGNIERILRNAKIYELASDISFSNLSTNKDYRVRVGIKNIQARQDCVNALSEWCKQNNVNTKNTSDKKRLGINIEIQPNIFVDLIIKPHMTKADGSGIADTHELITAALCMLDQQEYSNIKTDADANLLLQKIEDVIKSGKILNYSKKDFLTLNADNEKNLNNIAAAISAARKIRQVFNEQPTKIFLTGKTWDKEISHFRMNMFAMKDYNSSDIVLRSNNNFLGVSLKKKYRTNESDPTLIGRSFTSVLNTAIPNVKEDILNCVENFFIKKLNSSGVYNQKIDNRNFNKYINDYAAQYSKEFQSWIKGKDSVFKLVDDIIKKYTFEFADQLTELIFKRELSKLKKQNFDFGVCVGIGKYYKTTGFKIEQASYMSIENSTSVISELCKKGQPKIIPNNNELQAYDEKSTAATLKYILEIGGFPVARIELRYTGNFASSPRFNAFLTDEFKKLVE